MSGMSHRLQESVGRARKQRGWSQRRLADEAGVAIETVRKLESDRPWVSLALLERVATALEVPVAMLLNDGRPLVGWGSLSETEQTLVQALVDYFTAQTGAETVG